MTKALLEDDVPRRDNDEESPSMVCDEEPIDSAAIKQQNQQNDSSDPEQANFCLLDELEGEDAVAKHESRGPLLTDRYLGHMNMSARDMDSLNRDNKRSRILHIQDSVVKQNFHQSSVNLDYDH